MNAPLLTVDVAHPSRPPDQVEEELLHAWSQIRNSPSLSVLKIIHGYGSSGKGGSTKDVVRNWAFRHRSRFRRIIEGERYTLYNEDTRELRKEVGSYEDADLQHANPGLTVVWVK